MGRQDQRPTPAVLHPPTATLRALTMGESSTYQFLSPAQMIAGDGASEQVGPLLTDWSIPVHSAVAVVGDGDVLDLALAKPILASLGACGFRPNIVACPPGEPRLDGVREVVAELRLMKPAACVGIGGGSAMDVAKLAAALTTNSGDVTEFVGANKVNLPSIPTIMVPTTAGTGSEATQVAMLSVQGKKAAAASAHLMARAAILDPSLVVGLPRTVTTASGLDALSHAFESYLSTRANSSTQGASLHGAALIASSIEAVVADGTDIDLRMAMLTGAYWSGIGLNASVVLGHSIAYTIANRTGLPHGVTCAMALPYCLAYNERASGGRIARLAFELREQIGDSGGSQPSDPTGIYGWLAGLGKKLELPRSLSEVGIGQGDLDDMVQECITSYPRANNPAPFHEQALRQLYDHLYAGDIHGCAASFQDA